MWAFMLEGCCVPESSPLTPLRREASTSQNILGNDDVTLKRGREQMRSIPDRAMRGAVASGVRLPCTLHGEMKLEQPTNTSIL